MTQEEADAYRYDILDLTKDWLNVTYHEVGRIHLTQNPENYFAEIEQSHFSPGHLVPGWEPSTDPVLQARLFSYGGASPDQMYRYLGAYVPRFADAQRYRLGVNYMVSEYLCSSTKIVAHFVFVATACQRTDIACWYVIRCLSYVAGR